MKLTNLTYFVKCPEDFHNEDFPLYELSIFGFLFHITSYGKVAE
jgi:hypothetical protein